MSKIINKIKQKKNFSQLPDSIVRRAGDLVNGDIKESRALLRKYFGVFLTNKVLKAKDESILKSHISTRNRDYEGLYKRILKNEKTIIDLGCGVNGFSYKFFPEKIKYIGVEGVGQLVWLMNNYFKDNKFNAVAVHCDLFDIKCILSILKKQKKPQTVFMLNIIDALEFFEKDFSKKFILEISKECEKIILSFPTESLSGKKKFKVKRGWLLDFIKENFEILDEFEMQGERFVVFRMLLIK